MQKVVKDVRGLCIAAKADALEKAAMVLVKVEAAESVGTAIQPVKGVCFAGSGEGTSEDSKSEDSGSEDSGSGDGRVSGGGTEFSQRSGREAARAGRVMLALTALVATVT